MATCSWLETGPNGEITVFRGITADGKPQQTSTFITGLKAPFGLAFYPPGNNPQYLYVGNTASVVRIPYKSGDLKATGPAEDHYPEPSRRRPLHARCPVFAGRQEDVRLGRLRHRTCEDDPELQTQEVHRADILQYTPDGTFVKVYACGHSQPRGHRGQSDDRRNVVLGERAR